jgi:TatD DNase family protein
MAAFLKSLENIENNFQSQKWPPKYRIISNSTNIQSSKRNIEISSKLHRSVIPFVGIHPETVMEIGPAKNIGEKIEDYCHQLEDILESARGMGEVGLDPKYGYEDLQLLILKNQLEILESKPSLPISIHTRNTIEQVLEILSTFKVSNRVLFHWFAGNQSDLENVQSKGYFVSFGPALIFSKRLQSLLRSANLKLVLAETDSPLIFSSISKKEPLSPFAVTSVIFKMAEVTGSSYDEMSYIMEKNTDDYLQAQNSLRVST